MEVNIMKVLYDIEEVLQKEIQVRQANQSISDNYQNYTVNNHNAYNQSKGDHVKTNHKTHSSKNHNHTKQSNKTSKFIKKHSEKSNTISSEEQSSSDQSDDDYVGGQQNNNNANEEFSNTSILSSQINEDHGKRGKEDVKSIYSEIVKMANSEGRQKEEARSRLEQESSQYQNGTTQGGNNSPPYHIQQQMLAKQETIQDGLLIFNGDELENLHAKKLNFDIQKMAARQNEPRNSEIINDKQIQEKIALINQKTLDIKRMRMMSHQIENEEQKGKKRSSIFLQNITKIQTRIGESDEEHSEKTPKQNGRKRRNSDNSNSVSRQNSLSNSRSQKSAVGRSKTTSPRQRGNIKEKLKQNQEILDQLKNKRKKSQKIKDLVEQHFQKQEQQKKEKIKLKRETIKSKIAHVKIPKNQEATSSQIDSAKNTNKDTTKNTQIILGSQSSSITPTFHPSSHINSPLPNSLTTSGINITSLSKKQSLLNYLQQKQSMKESVIDGFLENQLQSEQWTDKKVERKEIVENIQFDITAESIPFPPQIQSVVYNATNYEINVLQNFDSDYLSYSSDDQEQKKQKDKSKAKSRNVTQEITKNGFVACKKQYLDSPQKQEDKVDRQKLSQKASQNQTGLTHSVTSSCYQKIQGKQTIRTAFNSILPNSYKISRQEQEAQKAKVTIKQ
eukprot:403372677